MRVGILPTTEKYLNVCTCMRIKAPKISLIPLLFYFYQILTAFHMLNIVSGVAHDNWEKLKLLTGLIN
jgi:hypothetical protein